MKQKDKTDGVMVINTKSQISDDIQAQIEVSEKLGEAKTHQIPVANNSSTVTANVESIEKVNYVPTVNRSNSTDDKGKFLPKVAHDGVTRKDRETNTKQQRWSRYDDDKSNSMSLPPQQPSRRPERDDRHGNRTYGQSNRHNRSSQAPLSLQHTNAPSNGKPMSNQRNGHKRNDDIPTYPRVNRNAKQLIGRPVLINTTVTAPIIAAPSLYGTYYFSGPAIDTVASIKESIKRQM
jgi:hypothetical protein